MVYFGLPLLLTCNTVVAAVTLWITGSALRSSTRRRFWMKVTPALAMTVVAYLVWAVVITDTSYPDPICPDNILPWVPSWVPSCLIRAENGHLSGAAASAVAIYRF